MSLNHNEDWDIMDANDAFDEYPDNDYGMNPNLFMGPYEERNNRYSNAYGDYRGGYGPMSGRGGYGPLRNYGPHGDFGPPNFGPPRPFGPPRDFGPRNFGPQPLFPHGPPRMTWRRPQTNHVVKFLSKCGMSKEHLKKLTNDILNLISPEYCGLCAVEMDTFAVSRIHYISKNHLKNQKKWLAKKPIIEGNRGKLGPIKPRDQYCELCDIEITSKLHSESHYAGKTHRAIVDGRKKPKNPILLQPGMESRVTQLCRREKKVLKPAVPDTDKQEQDKNSAEKVSSDLYCEICKTFATCTEQMTLHLNGKRHLTKEKQYILKMMKGETAKEKIDETAAGEEAEGEAADEEELTDNENEEETNTAAAIANDWEKNGENWDEPETKN